MYSFNLRLQLGHFTTKPYSSRQGRVRQFEIARTAVDLRDNLDTR